MNQVAFEQLKNEIKEQSKGKLPKYLQRRTDLSFGTLAKYASAYLYNKWYSCRDCNLRSGQHHIMPKAGSFISTDQHYIVHDDPWLTANQEVEGNLCLVCFTRRLGRPVTVHDFKNDLPYMPPPDQDTLDQVNALALNPQLVRLCAQCESVFYKPHHLSMSKWIQRRLCSRQCNGQARSGKTAVALCRECNKPTKHHVSKTGLVTCGDADCREKSRLRKNENIASRHRKDYASGKRSKIHHTWDTVSRVSPEEELLNEWFKERGWVSQYKYVTGISDVHLPRTYWFDFADPVNKLYIEIDGTTHRFRKQRDARKDKIAQSRGWRGFRVSATEVRANIDNVKAAISKWITSLL